MFDPITYVPSRHEQGWLLESFGDWLDDGTLSDVLYSVRGGKEANVYCCRGGPSLDHRLVAAKVYRPRKYRELSNDSVYREGRGLLDENGHGVRARDRRAAQAIRKGTAYGKHLSHTSWIKHELVGLQTLFDAGGSVPEPIAASMNAVLMGFVGDEHGAAPTLDRLRPEPEEAQAIVTEVLRNVELLLSYGWVHGDLSLYNLLYWEQRVYVIDLPQISDVLGNPNALDLFRRDVARICEGFRRCGVSVDARAAADEIWDRVFETDEGVPEIPIATVVPFDFRSEVRPVRSRSRKSRYA